MSTLYKKRDIWYLSVSVNRKRTSRSLFTKNKQTANRIKPGVELALLSELTGSAMNKQNLAFDKLVMLYLEADHNWSKRTKELNGYVFESYLSRQVRFKDITIQLFGAFGPIMVCFQIKHDQLVKSKILFIHCGTSEF